MAFYPFYSLYAVRVCYRLYAVSFFFSNRSRRLVTRFPRSEMCFFFKSRGGSVAVHCVLLFLNISGGNWNKKYLVHFGRTSYVIIEIINWGLYAINTSLRRFHFFIAYIAYEPHFIKWNLLKEVQRFVSNIHKQYVS